MIKRFLVCSVFLFCLLPAVSSAQSADELMAKSKAWFKSSKAWSLKFRLVHEYAGSKDKVSQSGSLLVGEDNRFRLQVPGIAFYSDGASLWQWNQEQKQVLIKSLADLSGAFHPSELLFKYLNCKAVSATKSIWNGKPVWILKLDPLPYANQFSAMEVYLGSDYAPLRLITVDSTGSTSWYDILDLKKESNPGDAEFKFKSSPDIDEIDMR